MTDRWASVDSAICGGIPSVTPAAVLCVVRDGVVIERAYGRLEPTAEAPETTVTTLFDLASITKPFTASLFLQLIDGGLVALDTPVAQVLPEFSGVRPLASSEDPLTGEPVSYGHEQQAVDAERVTFHHLLTHTSGLAAWLPLYREANRAAALRSLYRHPFAYPPGAQSVYSDLGLILLGEAITRLTKQPLAVALHERLLTPLGATSVHFRPIADEPLPPAPGHPQANIAPTEICRWRGRRLQGEVDDENAARMGGVAGHAGLFGTARDVARLGEMYLNGGVFNGHQILRAATVQMATRRQGGSQEAPRGLGWMLIPPEFVARQAHSGPAFSPGSYGHTGFTGGRIWVDPERRIVYVLLTNRIYGGRDTDLEAFISYHARCSSAALAVLDTL